MKFNKTHAIRLLTVLLVIALVVPILTTLADETGVTATANSGLQLRTGPDTKYASVGVIPVNVTVPVHGHTGDWLLVEYQGVRGWVAGWLATVNGDINATPVTTELTGPVVIVTTQITLKMRSGPGFEYADMSNSIPAITDVPAFGRTANSAWFLVEYNGQRGWIAGWLSWINGDLSLMPITDEGGTPGDVPPPPSDPPPPNDPPADDPTPVPPEGVHATPNNTLNMREGPGTNYAVVGKATAGVALPVLGRNADSSWIYVNANGVEGWIAAWLTVISGDINSVPVKEAPAPPPSAPDNPPPPPPGGGSGYFETGGQTHTLDNPGAMHYAGMGWVKFQHKWSPGQNPNELAGRIEQAHSNGFKVLLSIPGQSHPSGIDYNAYVQFVAGVAGYGADAIEIWNEMNLDREWPTGQIDPAAYVNNMLAPAYRAIKAANPGTMVVAGALAPTGVHNGVSVWRDDVYLAGMRDAGAARYMDCLGVHYNAGATSPDDYSGHPADGGAAHYSWYFWGTYNLYAGTFPDTELCYTEIGWVTGEGYGGLPPSFWWGGGNTVGEQAEWLARSAVLLNATGRTRMMIIFNVDFTHWGDDPQAGYAIIRPGGGCPACDALHNLGN